MENKEQKQILTEGQKTAIIYGILTAMILALVFWAVYMLTNREPILVEVGVEVTYPEAKEASEVPVSMPTVPLVSGEIIGEGARGYAIPDRSKPIYQIYEYWDWLNTGKKIEQDVSAEHQWLIADWCEATGYDEKIVFSVIARESKFNTNAICSENKYMGWSQQALYWQSDRATRGGLDRYTDDSAKRDIYNPAHHMTTLAEMWNWCVKQYDIDLTADDGYWKLLYWHSTGKNPNENKAVGFYYCRDVFRYAELLEDMTEFVLSDREQEPITMELWLSRYYFQDEHILAEIAYTPVMNEDYTYG